MPLGLSIDKFSCDKVIFGRCLSLDSFEIYQGVGDSQMGSLKFVCEWDYPNMVNFILGAESYDLAGWCHFYEVSESRLQCPNRE
jgi:hypothetical protein